MSDQIPPDVFASVTGEEPDPEVIARIRARLERALDETADPVAPRHLNQGEIVVLQLDEQTEPVDTEPTRPKRPWLLIAAALVILAIGVGVVESLRDSDGDIDVSSGQPDDTDPAQTGTTDVVDTVGSIPTLGRPVPPGVYATDQLGVPLSFEIPADATGWTVAANNSTGFSLEARGTGLIGFARIGSLFDAQQAIDPLTTGLGNIPPNAIDVWIAATGAVVTDAGETEIDGRRAIYRQLAAPAGAGVDTGLCPAEAVGCLLMTSSSADVIDERQAALTTVSMTPTSFWIVELDGFEPFGIMASAPPTSESWLELIQPLLDSIELGAPAPAIEGGTTRVPEREEFVAAYTGTRPSGPTAGSVTAAGASTLAGDLVGDIVSTGTPITPDSRFDDAVFTGTIDGVGTGTLTIRQDWTAPGPTITAYVTAGTGDFAGATGEVTIVPDGDDANATSGQMTFRLVTPPPS